MKEHPPRVSLAHWPTPLEPLARLSERLGGPQIWVKRDDLTGLAFGGNKARKLEFLIADALQQGAQTIITTGSVQSNHARQTAAAAARYGLRCILVLSPMAPPCITGNLLLDRLLGAYIRWTGDRNRDEVMQEVAEEERAAGRKPYIIPYGGSNGLGAVAYFEAMHELMRQSREYGVEFQSILVASSSGGTQAGLVAGAAALHYPGRIIGISVDKPAETLAPWVYELACRAMEIKGVRVPVSQEAVHINDAYIGEGYGLMGDAEREVIQLLARTEGLLLDPVYTAKAMVGLIDLVRQKEWRADEAVLFWHTGGTPALFAYARDLLR